MERIHKYLPWTIRIIVFILFIVSGIAKMFPIWAFEKQLVDLGISTWCQATYLSRLIIALEIAIGIAILQNHFIKRIIIPSTILLLTAFCIHLSIQMYQHGAMNGNCGCFGQLIPMTPLEAFIKNIITIGLLIYLYKKASEKEKGQNKFINLILIFLASTLFLFIFFPFCPCPEEEKSLPLAPIIETDSIQNDLIQVDIPDTVPVKDTIKKIGIKKEPEPIKQSAEYAPKKVNSKFSIYSDFAGKKVDLNEGKKIICLFAPGCDHCRETAKAICSLSKKGKFPEVYILFMDEETFLIPDFFKEAQCEFPHQVIDIPKFWELMGIGSNTPGVFCVWNGNITRSFEGIDKNKFDPDGLKKAFEPK